MDRTTSSQWAVGASVTFNEIARTSENPVTRSLAGGLHQLSEAIRALGSEIEQLERRVGTASAAPRAPIERGE